VHGLMGFSADSLENSQDRPPVSGAENIVSRALMLVRVNLATQLLMKA
jgi:hypothetical protein